MFDKIKKDPAFPEQYLVIMGWYACDGEERWCPDCARTGKQYSAVYMLEYKEGHKNPETGMLDEIFSTYWGVVVRCKDCRLHIWTDKDNVERRRNYPKKKKETK